MANAITVKVKGGDQSCAGEWGILHAGEVRSLPATVAESLIRAGLATEVLPDEDEGEPTEKKGTSKKAARVSKPPAPQSSAAS
jgi:hypothetical protein